jgi:rhamnulokinase
MLPDYFYYRLTGIKTHEYTNATTTGMVNPLTGEFDQDLVRTLECRSACFRKSRNQDYVNRSGKNIQKQA